MAPPAGQNFPVVLDRLGQADQVGQDLAEDVGVDVSVQQEPAHPAQAADRVELGQRGHLTAVHPCVGAREPVPDGLRDVPVEGVQGAGVASGAVGGGVQGEGERGRPVVEVAVRAADGGFGCGAGEPVVGALPRPLVGAGPLDVQQRDTGCAVCERLRPPALAVMQLPYVLW